MYTKEQIRKGIESELFDPNKKRGGVQIVDAIMSEIERLANSDKPYIQPLAVEIHNHEFGQSELHLTLRINAAIVGYSPKYVRYAAPNWHEIKKDLMSGELSVHTKNTGIDQSVFFKPVEMSVNTTYERPLNIGVVSVGDISGYLLPNGTINNTLIILSILDGSLVIKARK
jgi:hypothetical protein